MTADDTNSDALNSPVFSSSSRRFPLESRVRVAETGSTNADVLAWASSESPPGSVLVAAHQSAGRGRLDRTWEAKSGDALLVSFLVGGADVHGLLPLALGVAALDVVHTRGASSAGLKWPNDIMVGSQKLAGILVEVAPGETEIAAAAGIGLNLGAAPVGAVALRTLVGIDDDAAIGVDSVLDDLCVSFDKWLDVLLDGAAGRAAFVEAYRDRCVTVGQRVRVDKIDGGSFEGEAVGIDEDGRLLVGSVGGSDGEAIAVQAGDVHHLRPA